MLERSRLAWVERLRGGRLPRALGRLRHPFESLPSRIITSVFAAALVTSLAVTWIATESTETFLRSKIDEKFPAILRTARARLDLWYSQREIEIQTFATSSTMLENAGRLGAATPRRVRQRSRDELRRYLSYVLDSFPPYEAIFLLDARGEEVVRVGSDFEIPEPALKRIAGVHSAAVRDLRGVGGRALQVASAPVRDSRGHEVGSLHALIALASVEGVLPRDDLGASGRIYLVDARGAPLVRGGDPEEHPAASPWQPGSGGAFGAREYTHPDGERVIGDALPFPRFGWTIVVEEAYDDAFAPVVSVIREILVINLGIVGVFGLIAYWIARSIVRPVQALSRGALRIANGETGVVIDAEPGGDEIGVLTRAFNLMSSQLRRNQLDLEMQREEIEEANRRLVTQNEELARLSVTDDLTKLHNHRFFQEHLPREMKRARRSKEPLSLMLIDIDDFKLLNDQYGHAVGDAVLRRLAVVMRGVIRETDLLSRYGGEEFALLANHTDLEGAVALAEKVRAAVSDTRFAIPDARKPTDVHVTVSIGVAAFRGDAKRLFNEADRALYQAKGAGKDCVRVAE